MLKKKKTEEVLKEELKCASQQLAALKQSFEELQFAFNRSRCREEELKGEVQQLAAEKTDSERRAQLLVGMGA